MVPRAVDELVAIGKLLAADDCGFRDVYRGNLPDAWIERTPALEAGLEAVYGGGGVD